MLNVKIINSIKFLIIAVGMVPMLSNSGTWTGPATQYTVKVKKVELCTDSSCSTAHILVTKTAAMDIASAAVGAAVGSYASTMTLPAMGVAYSHMRVTLDRKFTITGYGASSDSAGNFCYTVTDSDGTANVLAAGKRATSASDAADNATPATLILANKDETVDAVGDGVTNTTAVTMTYGSGITFSGEDMLYIKALTAAYTYYGQTPSIDLSFGTANAVTSIDITGTANADDDCNMHPGEPTMTIKIT